jgi:hypothetical protein
MPGSTDRRITSKMALGIKQDPISKITIRKGWEHGSSGRMPA